MTDTLAARDIARVLATAEPRRKITAWTITPEAYPVLTPSTESLDRIAASTVDGHEVRVFVKTIHSMRLLDLRAALDPVFGRFGTDERGSRRPR